MNYFLVLYFFFFLPLRGWARFQEPAPTSLFLSRPPVVWWESTPGVLVFWELCGLMWLLWDSLSVKWTRTESLQSYKMCCLSLRSGFPSPRLTHTFLCFPSHHSSPLLLYAEVLTKATPDPTHTHTHTHWSWEKDKPEISSPPCFSASLDWLFHFLKRRRAYMID